MGSASVAVPLATIVRVVLAFCLAFVGIHILKRWAFRVGWLDIAGGDGLKIHGHPVPFVGGLGIACGCVTGIMLPGGAKRPVILDAIVILAALSCLLGLRDDVRPLSPKMRLVLELTLGLLLAVAGLVSIPLSTSLVQSLALALFVAVFVTGAINAFNMIDGLDGLAGSVALISCIGYSIVGAKMDRLPVFLIALVLGASLLAFLLFNRHPATVFMGNNGSYLVGFLLASMSLLVVAASPGIPTLAGSIFLIGVPVFDTAFAIARRVMRGDSPFKGDRSHFYDYLRGKGMSVSTVALASCSIQFLCAGAGVALILAYRRG